MIVFVVLWIAFALISTWGAWLYLNSLRPLSMPTNRPRITVLSPIKGWSDISPRFVDALLTQDYANYRVIFCIESEADPAFAPLAGRMTGTQGRAELLVAGPASRRAQKVENLLAGLDRLTPDDEIVVLVDADTQLSPHWLLDLTRTLLFGTAEAASGWCWLYPADNHLASWIAAMIQNGIAVLPRPQAMMLTWGGSTAVTRTALERIDLKQVWSGTVLDDLTLASALHRNGIGIHAALRLLVPTPVRYDWQSFFAYARRQYQFVRIFALRHWVLALAAAFVPIVGFCALLIVGREAPILAASTVILILLLQQLRLMLRGWIARDILPEAVMPQVRRAMAWNRLFYPALPWIHAAILLASASGNVIRWAGITYLVDGPTRTKVVRPD
jgi:cellulose synthase/poly-beta-1,6-N-acetylglucosamine synthase-like glycosyltransferase